MPKKKLILIHGLNNKIDALFELGKGFEAEYNVVYLKLPHHGPEPFCFDFSSNLQMFKEDLEKELTESTYIISYSLGCAYLQYLFENGLLTFPYERVVYLSPALKPKIKLALFKYLPLYFPIPSFSPREFRLRNFCFWGQYKMLAELTKTLELKFYPKIYADPLDEMIVLSSLEFTPLNRSYLSYREHHLSFHPRYFKDDDWKKLIADIKNSF